MMKCMSLSTKKCAPVSINIFGLLSVVCAVIGHNGFNEKPETGWFRMGVNIDKNTASILEQRHHQHHTRAISETNVSFSLCLCSSPSTPQFGGIQGEHVMLFVIKIFVFSLLFCGGVRGKSTIAMAHG